MKNKEERSLMKYNCGNTGIVNHNMNESEWKRTAEELWRLLDDIDTASDMLKPEKNNFYHYVMKKAEERFNLIGSDGYILFPVERTDIEF